MGILSTNCSSSTYFGNELAQLQSVTGRLYDVSVTFSNSLYVVSDPPTSLPNRFTLRFSSPANHVSGYKIQISGVDYTVVTATSPSESAPSGIFAYGALVSFDVDKSSKKAFFKPGAGGGDKWKIFTGSSSTPPTSVMEGLYFKSSTKPTKIIITDSMDMAGTWSNTGVFSSPRYYMGGCMVGSLCYLAGGLTSSGAVSRFDSYDPVQNLWSTLPSMSVTRYAMGACSVGNVCYFAGGYVGSGSSSRLDAFDTVSKTWSSLANMPTPRMYIGACSIGTVCYFNGGKNDTEVLKTMESYSTTSNLWSTLTSMPYQRSHRSVGVMDSVCYFFGGDTAVSQTSSIDKFSPSSNLWNTEFSYLNRIKGSSTACVIGKLFYIAGGKGSGNEIGTIEMECFDPSSALVTSLVPMPVGRSGAFGCVVDSKCYYIGGINDTTIIDEIHSFNPAGDHTKGTALIITSQYKNKVRLYHTGSDDNVDLVIGVGAVYMHDGTQFNKANAATRIDNTGWRTVG